MTTASARVRRNNLVAWFWILACIAALGFCAACAATGSGLLGGGLGALVAGPPGFLAGFIGGLIGFSWTTIVDYWHNTWDWLTGADPAPHIPTATEILWACIKFTLLVGAVIFLLKLWGSRYRALIWNTLRNWNKPVVAVKSALAAAGVLHTEVVKPKETP